MAEPIQDRIKRSINATEGLYHRLVLLVGEIGSGKTEVLRDVACDLGTEVINVNLTLSAELLELTTKQRALHLPEILDQILDKAQSIVVLDNLEIIFDKDLQQDPLRLLQGISRNRSVIASWNGTATNDKLRYAEAGHPEYQSYNLVDLTVVSMDETATANSDTIINEAGQA